MRGFGDAAMGVVELRQIPAGARMAKLAYGKLNDDATVVAIKTIENV